MFTKEEKEKLKQMEALFEEIERIYNEFDLQTQEYILEYHNSDSSLPHCIRWGLQATEELQREQTMFELGSLFIVKEDIDFGIGYVPKGASAKLESIDRGLLHDEESKPFQFGFDAFVACQEEDEADGYFEDLSAKDIKKYLKQVDE